MKIEPIPFKGWINFEDALRVERIILPRKIWSISGVTTIIVVAAIAVNVMAIDTSWPYTFLFLGIAAAFIGGMFWLISRTNLNAKRKHFGKELVERSGVVAEDRITVATEKTKTELQWDLFDRFIETDGLVLAVKDKEYMAFAPYMFDSKEKWEACRQIVRSKKMEPQPGQPG